MANMRQSSLDGLTGRNSVLTPKPRPSSSETNLRKLAGGDTTRPGSALGLLQGNLEDSQLLGQKRPGFSRLGFNLLMTARDPEPGGKALSTWY